MSNLFRYQQFTIDQSHAAMKVGTDSDLLGTLAAGGRQILDIGTGTGVLSLMMAQRCPGAEITAIEIDDNAILDAQTNFAANDLGKNIILHHVAFQEYVEQVGESAPLFDAVLCNPPYFDRSLECDTLSKTRARHSSSLPFEDLIGGAYRLLFPGGVFSVCIPPEVLTKFVKIAEDFGFFLRDKFIIKSVPYKPAKRFVLVFQKAQEGSRVVQGGSNEFKEGSRAGVNEQTFCMRNADGTRSDWYKAQMAPFLCTNSPV